MQAALQLNVFRSTPYQRWRGAALLAHSQNTQRRSTRPRIGVAIAAKGRSTTISVGTLADRLAAEPGIASVSVADRARPDYLRHLVQADSLDRLVVGTQSDAWVSEFPAIMPGRARRGRTAVRVVDLAHFCGPVRESAKSTAKALVLLMAAAARLRSPNALAPAGIDQEIRAVLSRGDTGLSPRVPVLTCPAGLDSLRMIGHIGFPYLPGAIPVEVPCHLNMNRRLTARALELGAVAVLVIGCVPRCARGCCAPQTQGKAATRAPSPWPDREEQPVVTMTVFGFKGLAEALDACLGRL